MGAQHTGLGPLFAAPPRQRPPHFNGATYSRAEDDARLSRQHELIRNLMADGHWRTLAEIEGATGQPAASVSAQLRHLRKPRFGSWVVEKRSRGERSRGLYEYRVLPKGSATEECRRRTAQDRIGELLRRVADLEAENRMLREQVAR